MKGITRRLDKLENVVKPAPGVVVFYGDNEGCYYTKPSYQKGAQLVTPEMMEKAQKTKTVILLKYEEKSPAGTI